MALPDTVWTEYFPEDPSLETADHLPLWLLKDDSFEWYGEPTGRRALTTDNVLLPIKFYLDSNLDKLSLFATNTITGNATITLKIIQGAKVVTTNTTVTSEEDIELSINIKDEGFSTGDALLELISRGSYNIKDIKIVGFCFGGWTEFSPPETSWTEQ